MMKRLLLALLLAAPGLSWAAGAQHLDSVAVDLADLGALQRGAKYYVNYCQGCHSLDFMRYNRMARDLGLSDKLAQDNLNFLTDKIGDPMGTALRRADAEAWFGIPVPDLSVIARSRTLDYLYTYLRGFYLDDSRPFGVNNLVLEAVSMPHVLGELQGWQRAVFKETEHDGVKAREFVRFEIDQPGALSTEEFDRLTRDLVTFLAYVGEPGKLDRQRLGVKVILFLILFTIVAYLLKKEYWKDVH